MSSCLKDVVLQILEAVEKISTKSDKAIKDYNNLLYSEAQLTKGELKKILRKYAESNLEATSENLSPFVTFLSQRWDRIKNTDAIYAHNYQSHTNQICISVAEILAQFTSKPVIQLLMPTLKSNYDDRLDSMIMSDNNATCIDVLRCVKTSTGNNVLKHTHPVEGMGSLLSEAEKNRVANYLPIIKTYQDLKQNFYQNPLSRQAETRFKKIENKLTKEVGSRILSTNKKPLATYGKTGWNLLEKNMYADMMNREQLVDTLLKLKPSDWEKFLTHFNSEDLRKIVLEDKTLLHVALDTHSYQGQDEHDRAVAFLLIDNYRNALVKRNEDYTGWFGSWTGYSKEQKMDAVIVVYDYLRRDADAPLANLRSYLKEEGCRLRLGPLMSNTLGKLVNQILLLGDLDYIKTLQLQFKQHKKQDEQTQLVRVA
jgi:hypothetical protein